MVYDDVCNFYALTSYVVTDFILGQRSGGNNIPIPFPQIIGHKEKLLH